MEQITDAQVFEQYGRLCVQQELLQGQINAAKLEINKRLNAPKPDESKPENQNVDAVDPKIAGD